MSPTKKQDQEKSFERFEKRAGITFVDKELLQTAFTHRSYLNETRIGKRTHNERLEFLGDAVIELIITDHLFRKFPDSHEGDLTAYRAALVNAVMLGGIAEELGMNECLLLSRGEAKDTGRARATILANTFEAVTGALYLDQGYAAAEVFVVAHVLPKMDEVVTKGLWRDAKSAYQELAQAKYGMTPSYKTVKAEGPDHAKQFVVEVSVGDVAVAEGEGKSKQEAEQAAAERALREGGESK
ncbi:MAG: ribonuclease III [Patescibacteria group bacterium]